MKPSPPYFRLCLFAFVVACCVGINFALSYLNFVTAHGWPAWRPGVGIALLFASMLLSFIGYAKCVQREVKPRPPLPQTPPQAAFGPR